MKKLTFILLIIHCSFIIVKAQPTLEWATRYITPPGYVQYISDVVTDNNGNTYITGRIEWGSYPNDSMVCVTLKLNSSGVIQWSGIYNGERKKFTQGNALAIDNHGNVYVSGSTLTQTTGSDYLTIKYNNDGDTIWTRKFDGMDSLDADVADDIAVDDSGNVYVTGHLYQSTFPDYCTIKYDSSGNQLWARFYNGIANRNDFAKQIAIDKNGEIIVTGNSERFSIGINDVVTLKYNPAGTQIWAKTYTGVNNTGADVYGNKMLVDKFNNFYLTCAVISARYILKYNSLGDTIWVRMNNANLPPGNASHYHLINMDSLLNIYVSGTGIDSNNRSDCVSIKYDGSSALIWKRNYAGMLYQSSDVGEDITVDKYGNVYTTGYNDSLWLFNNFLTLKYDSSGVFKWATRYDFAQFSDDKAFYIFLDTMNNIYVTGITAGGGIEFGGNITTVKYSQPPVGIINIGNEIPIESMLFQNFPNPFNSATNFEFRISNFEFVNLQIYDVLGRAITELVNKQLKTGSYRINWDASQYSTGVYFYRLIVNGNIVDTKKMTLLK